MHVRIGIVVLIASVASMPASAAPDPRAVEMRAHFEAGMAHFNLQEYDDAIKEFESGYRLKPDPVLLYNLAQAHRLAGHNERALYFYRAYLRSEPGARERDEVEARIRDLEAVREREPARQSEHPPEAFSRPTKNAGPSQTTIPAPASPASSLSTERLTATAAPTKAKKPVYKTWWLWTTVAGAVVVGAAVGTALALVPKNAAIPNTTDGNVPVTFH
jgi:tetratricopeptide (TPR) repeat protein